MKSVKIRKYWRFGLDFRPQKFVVTFKDKTQGTLEVSRIIEEIRLTVEREITREERLDLLIEIFNKICLNKKRFKIEYYKNINHMPATRKMNGSYIHVTDNMASLEQYKFAVNDEEKEKCKCVIDELMLDYNLEDYDSSSKEQKIIYNIKLAYETLKEHKKDKTDYIGLQNLNNLNELEIGIYFNILERFCSRKDFKGKFDHTTNVFNFPKKLF